jgi:type I restriction enzyme S subunit
MIASDLVERAYRRLKFAATINDETLRETTDPDGQLQYIDIGNVDSWGRINEVVTYRFKDAPSRARRVVRNGDVIVSTVRTYLQAIAPVIDPPDDLVVSTGFAVVRPKREILDPNFCKYLLRESRFLYEVEARSVGVSYPAINSSDLADIAIDLPPLPVQRRIAQYLDAETAEIDRLIAEKERMLTLLEEKRAALLAHAVTRGLDPNIPLKPSGLEWLDEIPEHWPIMRLKHFCRIGNGSTPNRENLDYWEDGEYPWLNSSVVGDRIVQAESRFVTEAALKECHLPKIDPPALLVAITGQGKTRGRSTVLTFEATINQHLAYLKPRLGAADCLYLSYLMDAAYLFVRSDSDGAGSTRGAITCEQLGNLRIPLPPLKEQQAILHSIRAGTERFDVIAVSAAESTRLLKERRSALITAAVTGQTPIEEIPR